MKWDRRIWNFDGGETIFHIKNLVRFRGCGIYLHKMVLADADDCFHTHPAFAFRIILKGGYVEQVYEPDDTGTSIGYYKRWTRGMMGLVRPEFTHRIHRLIDGPSYSLWFRGVRRHGIELIGDGWNERPQEG